MSQSDYSLAQEVYDLQTTEYVYCALLCLVVFEYVITLDQEIAVGWRRKFTATSLLLLSTRWLMVLNSIVIFVHVGPKGCRQIYVFVELFYMAVTANIALFSTLRIYALWQSSRARWPFSIAVLTLGLVPVGTNIYGWTKTSFDYVQLPVLSSCEEWTDLPDDVGNLFLYLTRCSVITSDVLVLAFTCAKSLSQFREMRRLGLRGSVSAVLLRDGTLYFVALLAMNVLELLTYANGLNEGAVYANVFVQSLPPLLVQRFMLNLRQLGEARDAAGSDAQHLSRFSLHFRVPSDFLGNIGEPLEGSGLAVGNEGEYGGAGKGDEMEGGENVPSRSDGQWDGTTRESREDSSSLGSVGMLAGVV